MIYADEELHRWWKGLSHADRRGLLDKIKDRAYSPGMVDLCARVEQRERLDQLQDTASLRMLRKWI